MGVLMNKKKYRENEKEILHADLANLRKERAELIDRLFFLFRPKLKKAVAEIEEKMDMIWARIRQINSEETDKRLGKF